MPDLFELVVSIGRAGLRREAAEEVLASADPADLKHAMAGYGLAEADLPRDRRALAKIYAALLAPFSDAEQTTSGASELVRVVTCERTKGVNEIVTRVLDRDDAGTISLHEIERNKCPDDEPPHAPEPLPAPGPLPAPPPKKVHARVNVKLVCFIPFFGNDLPLLNRILPYWPGPSGGPPQMTFTQETALKVLFASGNPDPPDAFPTRADFQNFIASKEYRAVLDIDLLICCDLNGVDQIFERVTPYPGYTPALSELGLDHIGDLHKDHEAHESPAGQVRNLSIDPQASASISSYLGSVPGFIGGETADITKALLAAGQRPPAYGPAEPFSPGNLYKPDWQPPTKKWFSQQGNCMFGVPRIGFQVNDVENILYYALTGNLLPYMWGALPIKFCCGGALSVKVEGTSIPSKWLYVNNQRVDTAHFDMTKQTFKQLQESLPQFTQASHASDKAMLITPSALGLGLPSSIVPQVSHSSTQTMRDDCPGSISDTWIYFR